MEENFPIKGTMPDPQNENPRQPEVGDPGFMIFGDHAAYEGDNPWWTLRFRERLSAEKKKRLRERVGSWSDFAVFVEAGSWHDDRQVQLGSEPDCETDREWKAYYRRVDAIIGKIHAMSPLFAVFFQDGQFHGGKELSGLSDEELAATHQAMPEPVKKERANKPRVPRLEHEKERPPSPPIMPITSIINLDCNVSVEGVVEQLGKSRSIRKGDKSLRVREGTLRDASGTIGITFWADDVKLVQDGTRVRLENGWVGAHYNSGKPNLSRGKAGKLILLDGEPNSE